MDEANPLEGARRELMEETGYSAGNMIEVGRIYPNPAIQHNTLFCYLATDVELTGSQHFDETEELEVHLVKLDELLQMVTAIQTRLACGGAVSGVGAFGKNLTMGGRRQTAVSRLPSKLIGEGLGEIQASQR